MVPPVRPTFLSILERHGMAWRRHFKYHHQKTSRSVTDPNSSANSCPDKEKGNESQVIFVWGKRRMTSCALSKCRRKTKSINQWKKFNAHFDKRKIYPWKSKIQREKTGRRVWKRLHNFPVWPSGALQLWGLARRHDPRSEWGMLPSLWNYKWIWHGQGRINRMPKQDYQKSNKQCWEESNQTSKGPKVNAGSRESRAHSMKSEAPKRKPQNNKCTRCRRTLFHNWQSSPAKNATYRRCGKLGHYASECRTKSIQEVTTEDNKYSLVPSNRQIPKMTPGKSNCTLKDIS